MGVQPSISGRLPVHGAETQLCNFSNISHGISFSEVDVMVIDNDNSVILEVIITSKKLLVAMKVIS